MNSSFLLFYTIYTQSITPNSGRTKKFNEISPVSPLGSYSIYFCVLQYLYSIETDTV